MDEIIIMQKIKATKDKPFPLCKLFPGRLELADPGEYVLTITKLDESKQICKKCGVDTKAFSCECFLYENKSEGKCEKCGSSNIEQKKGYHCLTCDVHNYF